MTPDEMRERSNEYLEVSVVNGDLPDAVSTLLFLAAELCERLDKLIAAQPPKWKAGPR